MHASEVSGKLFEQLNFRGERQKVISSNIANVNTPDYKTKDLVFDEELKAQNILKLKRTSSNHMQNLDYRGSSNPRLVQVPNLRAKRWKQCKFR